MSSQHGWSRFEWLIVISAIGVVMLFGISRYLDLAREGRRMGFELLAHNFTAAVAMTRAQWLLKNSTLRHEQFLESGADTIYISPEGWPYATEPENENSPEDQARRCFQLWKVMLQNPEPVTVEGTGVWGERRYHISSHAKNICRYELVTRERGSHFFDYFTNSGRVIITVPIQDAVSTL